LKMKQYDFTRFVASLGYACAIYAFTQNARGIFSREGSKKALCGSLGLNDLRQAWHCIRALVAID
jgi:hypothetical protein